MGISWGDISKNVDEKCVRCFKKATFWFIRDNFFINEYLTYCDECLKERLDRLRIRR